MDHAGFSQSKIDFAKVVELCNKTVCVTVFFIRICSEFSPVKMALKRY